MRMVVPSDRVSNLEERAAWSAPRVTTSGQMTLREKDMAKEWTAQGVKPRILGYISIGESVPDVITTWLGFGLGLGLARGWSRHHASCVKRSCVSSAYVWPTWPPAMAALTGR